MSDRLIRESDIEKMYVDLCNHAGWDIRDVHFSTRDVLSNISNVPDAFNALIEDRELIDRNVLLARLYIALYQRQEEEHLPSAKLAKLSFAEVETLIKGVPAEITLKGLNR